MNADLEALLRDYALDNNMTVYELSSQLAIWTWLSRKTPKSGFGPIGESIHLVVDAEENTLRIKGEEWRGKSKCIQETVLVSNGRIVSASDVTKTKIDQMIIFSGEKVWFFDYTLQSSGYYDRAVVGC